MGQKGIVITLSHNKSNEIRQCLRMSACVRRNYIGNSAEP